MDIMMDRDGRKINLNSLGDLLTSEETRWVLDTAPAIVVDNNFATGKLDSRAYGDGKIHIQLYGSKPVIDYCQKDGTWSRVFDFGMRRNNRMGDWYTHLNKVAAQFGYKK